MKNTQVEYKFNSKIGPIYLRASKKGLQAINLQKSLKTQNLLKFFKNDPAHKILYKAMKEINDYLDGKTHKFTIPLDLQGTTFQKSVWKKLTQIPYGKTCSYSEIAQKIGNPKAVRAVGSANGKNPLCIIIPCHRVIAADGSLGGYTGGIKLKKKLLSLEGVNITE